MGSTVVNQVRVDIASNATQLQAELGKAERAIRGVGKAAGETGTLQEGLAQRVGAASTQIASAAENMVRAGKAGGDALKQVIVQGSNLAFLFGAQGAIVGAVGVATLAIVEAFRNARQESAELLRQTRADLLEIRNLTSRESAEQRRLALAFGDRALTSADVQDVRDTKGDREADRLEAQRRGIVELTRSTATLRAEIVGIQDDIAKAVQNNDTSPVERLNEAQAEKTAQLDKELKLLQLIAPQYAALTTKVQELANAEAARAAVTKRLDDEQKAREANKRAQGQAADLEASQRTAFRDISQGFGDLFAKATTGSVSLGDFERSVRELGDAFRDRLKKPTVEQATAFQELNRQAGVVKTTLQTMDAAKTAQEFAALRAALTPSVVDDYRVKIEQLRETLSKRFAPEQVQDLLALQQALADVAIGAEALDQRIEQVKARAISSFDAQLGLMQALQKAEEQLRLARTAPDAISDAGEIRIAGLLAQVKKLREEIDALSGRAASGASDEQAQSRAVANAQQLGRAIEDVGRLTISTADAFGVLSDEAAKALAATVDVAAGVGRIFSGDLAGGSAQTANGVISLLSTVLGKDPAAEQRKREHQENLATLERIAKNTGDLLGVQTSGRDIAGIRSAVGDLLAQTGDAGGFRRFGDGPLRNIDEAAFLQFKTGLDFKEIEALAKSLGVTLNGTKQSYIDFENALKQVDLEAFTQGFSGQLRRLEIETRLDPAAFEGLEGTIRRLRILAGPDGAPAIAAALGDLSNLDTSAGRADAIARLTAVLRNLGSLDVADLGGLSLDQFVEEILGAIEKLKAAEPAAVSAGQRFQEAMELLAVQVELGGFNAAQRLDKVKAAFQASFSDAFAQLDFSSLESLQASIAGIIAGLTADGKLTEEERALTEALRTLIGAFQDTQPVFSDFLAVLDDQFTIFRTGVVDRFEQLGAALRDKFPSLAELLDGIDLENDPGALASLQARAEAIFTALAEGGVTAEEQAIIDAIKQILGAAGDAVAQLAEAERTRLEELARWRDSILAGAETRIRLNDITDPVEQLRIRMTALGQAFPALAAALADFDISTQEGRDAVEAWIRAIADSPDELEALAKAMGITVDELLAALTGLEDGFDASATKLLTIADRLAGVFDELDFENELEGITDPLEQLKRTARGVAAVLPEVAAIFKQFNLDTAEGRAGAEAALIALGKSTSDAAVRSAVLKLLAQIRGVPTPESVLAGGSGSASAGSGAGGRANVASAASITEVTANRLVDLFQRNVFATEGILDAMRRSVAPAIAPLPTLSAPPVPSVAGALLGGSVQSAAAGIVLQVTLAPVFSGAITTSDPEELSRLVQRRLLDIVQGELATELLVALRRAGVARAN